MSGCRRGSLSASCAVLSTRHCTHPCRGVRVYGAGHRSPGTLRTGSADGCPPRAVAARRGGPRTFDRHHARSLQLPNPCSARAPCTRRWEPSASAWRRPDPPQGFGSMIRTSGSVQRGAITAACGHPVHMADRPIPTDDELQQRLTPLQYEVTQHAATEHAFSGTYWNVDDAGTYHCIVCDEPLFSSETKYDAGCGASPPTPSIPTRSHARRIGRTACSASRQCARTAAPTSAMCSPMARGRPATASA